MRISEKDIKLFTKSIVINSGEIFPEGTSDEHLTKISAEKGWVIVTKDIRMALRSLQENVPVIYVNDEFKTTSFLNVSLYGASKYPEMFAYAEKKYGYSHKK